MYISQDVLYIIFLFFIRFIIVPNLNLYSHSASGWQQGNL